MSASKLAKTVGACATVAALVVSASSSSADASRDTPARRPNATSSTCAGIRGNGQNLFAHYGALARHIEEYGAITCAAGGSSGSITTFVLESIWANPDLHNCASRSGVRTCSSPSRDARMSLMLKSVVGLVDTGLFGDIATVSALVDEIGARDIVALLNSEDPAEGIDALTRVLRDLGPLINPDLFELLANSPDPVFHATDIIDGLEKGLQFIVDDPNVFVRTSVLNFEEVALLFVHVEGERSDASRLEPVEHR